MGTGVLTSVTVFTGFRQVIGILYGVKRRQSNDKSGSNAMMTMEAYQKVRQLALQRYFGRMNPQQQEAVFTIDGPVLVLAGAGSGKTTVIVNRIANMIRFGNAYHAEATLPSEEDQAFVAAYAEGTETDADRLRDLLAVHPIRPWNILSITFTNKAAAEMKQRLEAMLGEEAHELQAATFHSACVRILRQEIHRLGYDRSFTIYDADDSQKLIKACLSDLGVSEKTFPPKMILSEISRAKDRLITPEGYAEQAGNDYRMMTVSKLYQEYQSRLKKSNAVDFDDIIVLTVRIFTEFPDALEKFQNRYRYILVDEYQDTNQAQFRLVSLLSQKYHNLCVVGDDDQSIYQFRGATVENILNFESQFPNCKVIRLEQNYRSTQRILDAANSVIRNNSSRKSKQLWTAGEQGEKIVWYKAQDERDEADYICRTIEENVKNGAKLSEHAVLYRMRAQSNAVEQALRHAGLAYRIYGGLRFFDRKEIKDITAYLSVINNNTDVLRFKRIVNEPKRGIGDATVTVLEEITRDLGISPLEVMRNAADYPMLSKKAAVLKSFAKTMDTLSELAETMELPEFLDAVLDKTGYRDSLRALGEEGVDRLLNIEELKSSMITYMNETEEPSLSGFLEEIALYTDQDRDDETDDAVTMMTVHSAKGLEYRYVFVVGMEENIFPTARCYETMDGLSEERRLAYVAITRAKERLYLLHASQRMLFGSTTRNAVSCFLKEIDPSLLERIDHTVKTYQAEGAPAVTAVHSMSLQRQLASQKKPASPAVQVVLSVGDRVRHNVFGEGTVLSITAMANDSMLEVAFDRVGTKKLMANYARVQKIS